MKTPNKIGLKKVTSENNYSFTKPLYYSKTIFGVKGETVTAYVLEVSALELTSIFKIFEDLPNVHEWPISKLIQRELDKQRAQLISRDYLLGGGFLKYFPPLTAVLIPTNVQHLPSDKYPTLRTDEEEEVTKFWKVNLPEYEAQLTQEVVTGGIYDLSANETPNGFVFWDVTVVSAVIIDGQHRYKALMDAMSASKEFQGCRVVVNLIDIPQISVRANKGPTSVARDLFVTINNTPVEVDEARLVLMDDRDALATFTQVLVDDSDSAAMPPAVPPELIDWKCEQGRHDSGLALTGVLTLRGVIATAMFQNRAIDSVAARSSRQVVKRWIEQMNLWVNPDPSLKQKFGPTETLKYQFDVASADSPENQDDEDEEQPFLFSYSAAAAGLIKQEFKGKYLPVFREVYRELTPYKQVREIATAAGAFDKGKELHRYLRAFTGQRAEMERGESEVKRAVASYKKEIQNRSVDKIPYTVMGQKAIFKALFDGYLSDVKIGPSALLKRTKEFVLHFNTTNDLLNPSANFDECFSSTKFQLKKPVEVSTAGDLARDFWRGIILGDKGQIDYGVTAVRLLSELYVDAILHKKGHAFKFTGQVEIIKRHVRLLQKFDSSISDTKANAVSKHIVVAKEKTIKKLLES